MRSSVISLARIVDLDMPRDRAAAMINCITCSGEKDARDNRWMIVNNWRPALAYHSPACSDHMSDGPCAACEVYKPQGKDMESSYLP